MWTPLRLVSVVFLSLLSVPGIGADVTSTLIASGDWTNDAIWDSTLHPHNGNGDLTYDAVINGGGVNLPALTEIEIEALFFHGGTLGGAGTLTISETSQWTGGFLSNGVTLAGDGPLTISGEATKGFYGAVSNSGTWVWQEGGVRSELNGSSITNTGLIDLQADGTSFYKNYNGTVINAEGGTLRRSTTEGTHTIALPVTNQGTIQVQSGTLQLAAGGSLAGTLDVAADSVLEILGSTSLNEGLTSTGEGIVRSNGTTTVNGAAQLQNFHLAGGILGGTGVLTLTGPSQWTSGTLAGPTAEGEVLTLSGEGPLTISGEATKGFYGAVSNSGTWVWQEGGVRSESHGSSITNTGLIDLQADGTSFYKNYNGTVINAEGGTLRRSTTEGTHAIALPVTNQGTIQVQSGTLQLAAGGSLAGTLDVAADSVLEILGSTSLNEGLTSTGEGIVRSNGTTTVNGAAQLQNFHLAGGILGGTGVLTLTGPSQWTSGTLAGPTAEGEVLTLSGEGPLTISGEATKGFYGAVSNSGTWVWQEGGVRSESHGSSITNTGLIDLQADGTSFYKNYNGTVINAEGGTLRRSTTEGTHTIALPVTNQGTIQVQSGTLQLAAGGSLAGALNIATDTVLELSGIFSLEDGLTSTGGGVVRSHGTTAVNGAAQLPGFHLAGGTLGGAGTLTISETSQWTGGFLSNGVTLSGEGPLTISGEATKGFSGAVSNSGTWVWQEGGVRSELNGSSITNTGLIDLQADGTSFYKNYNGTVINAEGGTLRRSTTEGTHTIALPVTNQGTIQVQSGTLQLAAGLSSLSAGTLLEGTYQVIADEQPVALQVAGGTAVTTIAAGAGVELSGAAAAATFNNALLAASLANNGGTLRIFDGHSFLMTATLINTGTVELGGEGLGGGALTSAGTITNALGASISGHGTINNSIANGGIVRADWGTLTIAGSTIDGADGDIHIANSAVLDLSAASGSSSAKVLTHEGAGLHLGPNDLRIASDYQNAHFGVGNSFNRRANVTGTGQIIAEPGVTQSLAGDVVGGSSAVSTMDFGNLHVGDSATLHYQIVNDGVAGPSLRGAIQTSAGGANLTDDRLVGTGVAASNFGPIAPAGSTDDLTVTFDATSAGALVDQHVAIVNNFDNVDDQVLTIQGAAYRLAQPSHAAVIDFGIVHVGDAVQQAVSLTNSAANDGYSEKLNAAIVGATGHATTNSGTITGLLPEATDSTSLLVAMDTSSPGSKFGTATIEFTSDGTGTSELGLTPLASQTVDVQVQVNHYAEADIAKVSGIGTLATIGENEFSLDFGTLLLGDNIQKAELGVSNNVAAPADELAGMFTMAAADFTFENLNSFADVAAGQTLGGMFVGFDPAEVGTFTGQITLEPRSTNASSFSLDLDPITIHLTAAVRRAGDFDNNGHVDGRDFLAWQRGVSPTPLSSDDLAEWQAAYGDVGSLAGAVNVPEPGAAAMVMLLAAVVVNRRSRG